MSAVINPNFVSMGNPTELGCLGDARQRPGT